MEGGIQLLRTATASTLDAQTTSKRAKCWNQHGPPVPAVQGHIPLRKNVVAIRNCLPAARAELRQRLADTDVKERIHLVERLAVAVQAGYRHTADPLVTGGDLRFRAGHGGGHRGTHRVVHRSL